VNGGITTDVAAPPPLPRARHVTRPVFAWPGWPHILQTLRYASITAALFAVIFGGADAFARLHAHRVDLTTPVDSIVPFVPAATVIYSSLYAMFWILPFVLSTEREIKGLARVIAWEIVIAAPFFLALPMPERTMPADLGSFPLAFRIADAINLQHNQFPSLHAAFALTVGIGLARRCRRPWPLFFFAWSLAIAASTLLTWQHVVVDVFGACILTIAVLWRSPLIAADSTNEVCS
jgi:membrane-associated phospholipid phosphatase